MLYKVTTPKPINVMEIKHGRTFLVLKPDSEVELTDEQRKQIDVLGYPKRFKLALEPVKPEPKSEPEEKEEAEEPEKPKKKTKAPLTPSAKLKNNGAKKKKTTARKRR